ncbi:EutP/PduV family microcompartment system protein [Escherichia coli]
MQGNYTLARKKHRPWNLMIRGDIDTPGEYFNHPRWYHALITTLQDVDMLIYVHGANDPESRFACRVAGYWRQQTANRRHQ